MKVQDVMTSEVKSCRPETNLAEAAAMMLDYDCGALPVVNNENKVVGMITDRDIAIAAATKARLASEIPVSEVISRKVCFATPDEDIHTALKTMRDEKEEGRHHPELTYEATMSTFKAICEHRPARQAAAA